MEQFTNFNRMCESILYVDELKANIKMEIIKRVALLYNALFSKSFYSAYRVNDDDEKPMFTVNVWADKKDGSESETPVFHVLINSRGERMKRSKIKTLGVDTTDDEIELIYMAMLPKIKKLQEFFE